MIGLGLGINRAALPQAAWKRALPALRSFVTANYNQPNPHNQAVMASPPTVTADGTTRQASFATFYATSDPLLQGSMVLRVLGGTMLFVGAGARVYSADIGATGGNAGLNDGRNCSSWRADVAVNAAKVSFRVSPTVAKYRFIVDGQYVDLVGTQTIATTGNTSEYITLDFTAVGGKKLRRIQIEGEQTCGLAQVWVQSGETAARPTDSPKRIAFAGDSFTLGSLSSQLADNFCWVAADTLGFAQSLNSGAGGTGYVATGSPGVKLADRLGDINSTGPHDVIVVAMGINDVTQGVSASDVSTQALACLQSFRSSNPAAQIFVVGPWDRMAPSAPDSGYAAIKSAIQSAVQSAGQGFTFLDPQGVAYTHGDVTHPDTAGHATLGLWLAGQIKTALGA